MRTRLAGRWGVWSWLAVGLACSGEGREQQAQGGESASPVERGRYLVAHVAGCGDCHSPRRPDRSFDPARWLSGIDCFVDVARDDPDTGCLSTRNLTNHETGLKNRSDRAIVDMITKGVRPDGTPLHPFMPYTAFANMRESDADAIVAYLRTVDGVDHMSARSQPPFLAPEQPAPPIPESGIPMPRADYPDRGAALRGRYLAGSVGGCLVCHTPRGERGLDLDRAFQGGRTFERAGLGLPSSYPDVIYTANLTPHATGILGYTVDGIARALKHGEDGNQGGARLCPPMPAGPDGAYGGLTDRDASDIGHYLLSLEPRENLIPADCAQAGERRASLAE